MGVLTSISDVPILVVLGAFRGIGKNTVSFVYLLETLFGPQIAGMSVRMGIQGQFAICFFYLFLRSIRRDAQCFVVVKIRHPAIFPENFFMALS